MRVKFDPVVIGREAVVTGRFRYLRRRIGMSEEGAGRLFGVSRSTIAKWETGLRLPSPRHARAIAEALPDLEAMAARIGRGTQ